MKNFKLCYIENNFAYFTTQELDKQWGDDWNDTPYEHNAGEPYGPVRTYSYVKDGELTRGSDYNEDGTPKWEIYKVAYNGPWDIKTPADIAGGNSQYSVQMINNKLTPWLVKSPDKVLFAGATISEFVQFIEDCGGTVYLPKQNSSAVVQYINDLATQIKKEDGVICIDDLPYQYEDFPPGFWRKLAKEVNYIDITGDYNGIT